MTREKQVKAYVKSLIKLCSQNGEFSEERAAAVLQVFEKNPPRNYGLVLKSLLKSVQRELAECTANVEYAGSLSTATVELIQSKLSTVYGRQISVQSCQNDALIAGIRVRVGCDVYESSIAGTLSELQSSLS